MDATRGLAWDGTLDEIGVWNTALNEADLQQLMSQSKVDIFKRELATDPVLENTINGVGLNPDGSHSQDKLTRWLSAKSESSAWIRYDLSTPQKLSEMLVWNHNSAFEFLARIIHDPSAEIAYLTESPGLALIADFNVFQYAFTRLTASSPGSTAIYAISLPCS